MVEPVDVLEGGVLDLVEIPPWSLRSDEFGLVQADDRLCQSVDAAIVKYWSQGAGMVGCRVR